MSDNGCTANPYQDLIDVAIDTILKVTQEGEAKYPTNDFMDRVDHFAHSAGHWADYVEKRDKESLEHLFARIAIMLAILNKE
jgi:hypothetical protein